MLLSDIVRQTCKFIIVRERESGGREQRTVIKSRERRERRRRREEREGKERREGEGGGGREGDRGGERDRQREICAYI